MEGVHPNLCSVCTEGELIGVLPCEDKVHSIVICSATQLVL